MALQATIFNFDLELADHDRGRRSDAGRQGQNRHRGERGLTSEEPPRMS